MHKYRKKPEHAITAVQIKLETDGLRYRKWGDQQTAKAGDWLVDANGSVYTIKEQVFARTYEKISPGRYIKSAPIYAEQAAQGGAIETLEGRTHYQAGDYLVYEQPGQAEGAYAIKRAQFEEMYERLSDD